MDTRIHMKEKPFYLSEDAVQWVKTTLEHLSIEEKVGQLFVLANSGFDDGFEESLRYIKPGGVHLFGFQSSATKANQRTRIEAMQAQSTIPLLISGDLENGGQGGARDGTNFGTQMQVAAAADLKLTEEFGAGIAVEGSAMGFNWVFGPVADISYNFQNPIVNTRAFGDTPELVMEHASAVIRGLQKNHQMAATAKHFPGDGMDDRDQHKVLSMNTMYMEQWRKTYGQVYKNAIDSGVSAVMSAHIALPAYYEELGISDVRRKHTPGTLSFELNHKLLREELGFNGLIVSDATSMIGMQSFGIRREIVPQCIAAGVDMFLFTVDARYDYEAMLQGVRDGVISLARLDEAVMYILSLKASLGLNKPVVQSDLSVIGSAGHKELAGRIAKKSVTLVKDSQNILPISSSRQKKILLIAQGDNNSFFSDKADEGTAFKELLESEGFDVMIEYGLKEEDNDVDLVIYLVQKAPGFLQPSLRMSHKDMREVFTWYPTHIPTIFISLGNPYSLYEVPSMPTMINAYNGTLTVQREVLDCMLGRQPFVGQSPVDAFCGLEWATL